MTHQDARYEYIEKTLLKEADLLIEKAKSQGEKALYNLFKSTVLKKYKDQYDVEIQQGEVKKDILDKSIDFLFKESCVKFRTLPYLDDSVKEDVIRHTQATLGPWKAMIAQMLTEKGIKEV